MGIFYLFILCLRFCGLFCSTFCKTYFSIRKNDSFWFRGEGFDATFTEQNASTFDFSFLKIHFLTGFHGMFTFAAQIDGQCAAAAGRTEL